MNQLVEGHDGVLAGALGARRVPARLLEETGPPDEPVLVFLDFSGRSGGDGELPIWPCVGGIWTRSGAS